MRQDSFGEKVDRRSLRKRDFEVFQVALARTCQGDPRQAEHERALREVDEHRFSSRTRVIPFVQELSRARAPQPTRKVLELFLYLRFTTLFPSEAIFGRRRCVSASVSSWPKRFDSDMALCFESWWRLRKLALRSCSSITSACSRSLNRRPRKRFCMSWKLP